MNTTRIRKLYRGATPVVLVATALLLSGCLDYDTGVSVGHILRQLSDQFSEFLRGIASGYGQKFCSASLAPALLAGLVVVARRARH